MDLNDKELFESAISDAPIAEPAAPVEQPAEVTDGPVRDDRGRFASKEAPAEAPAALTAPEPAPAAKDEAHVPSWRLREVNDAREAAERRAQEAETQRVAFERQLADLQRQLQQATQKPQEPKDWYADPDGAIQDRLSPIEQRIAAAEQRAILRASRAEQVAEHGRTAIDEMEKAVGEAMRSGHPDMQALSMQMRNSDDPVGVAMQWYQRDKLVRETGGDVTAYRNKLSEDLLKDPAFLAKAVEAIRAQSGQPGSPAPVVQLPPSINRATSSASPHEEVGTMADADLYRFATR
jgi:hypothetical protein